MKTMRAFIISLCVLFTFNVYAQNTVLIYKDFSGSVSPSAAQKVAEETHLKTILVQQINTPGDKVIISYLYKNTASVTNQKVFVFPDPLAGRSAANDNTTEARNKSILMKAKFGFVTKVLNGLESDAPTSNETHILASLNRISALLKDSSSVQVIYLSDMLEYSSYRNLLHLKSKADAETKAEMDGKAIMGGFDIVSGGNPKLKIMVFLPVQTMENSKAFQFVEFYWRAVFKTVFEIENIIFHTL